MCSQSPLEFESWLLIPSTVWMSTNPLEFFRVYTKLTEVAALASKGLTVAKSTSSGAQPDARDYHWFRSPKPNQLS